MNYSIFVKKNLELIVEHGATSKKQARKIKKLLHKQYSKGFNIGIKQLVN